MQCKKQRQLLISQLVFFLLPGFVICYSILIVGSVNSYTVTVSIPQLLLGLLALGEIGAITASAWYRQMWATFVAGVVGTGLFPIVVQAVPGQSKAATGYVLFLFVLFMSVVASELLVTNRERIVGSIASRTGRICFAVGILHGVLAVTFQLTTRTLDSLLPLAIVAFPLLLALLVGLTAGATAMWIHEMTWSPVVGVVAWASVGAYQTIVFSTRYGAFSGINWSAITPSPDYLLSTPVLLVFVVFVAGAEYTVRRTVAELITQRV